MKDKDTIMLEEAYGETIQPNKSIHAQRIERQNQTDKPENNIDRHNESDLLWRLNDIREMLIAGHYGLDEWSSPIVNLDAAIKLIKGATGLWYHDGYLERQARAQ